MIQLIAIAFLAVCATAVAQEPPYELASDECTAGHYAIESDDHLIDISSSLLGPDYDPMCDLNPGVFSSCDDKWNETAAASWISRCEALSGVACFTDMNVTFRNSSITAIRRFDLLCRPLACNYTAAQDTEEIARNCASHYPDVVACDVKACKNEGHWENPAGQCLLGSVVINRDRKLKENLRDLLSHHYEKCLLFPGTCAGGLAGAPCECKTNKNETIALEWESRCKELKGEPCFMDMTVNFVNGSSTLIPGMIANCFPTACDNDDQWHQQAVEGARLCVDLYDDAASCDINACGHTALVHVENESPS